MNIKNLKETITLNNVDYYLCNEQDNLYTYRDCETETCCIGFYVDENGNIDSSNFKDYNIKDFGTLKDYILNKKDIYDKTYDYEDMKLAICVEDFTTMYNISIMFLEDLIELTQEIKENWKQEFDNKTLSKDEVGYIQEYAYRYLKEKFNIKEVR